MDFPTLLLAPSEKGSPVTMLALLLDALTSTLPPLSVFQSIPSSRMADRSAWKKTAEILTSRESRLTRGTSSGSLGFPGGSGRTS